MPDISMKNEEGPTMANDNDVSSAGAGQLPHQINSASSTDHDLKK